MSPPDTDDLLIAQFEVALRNLLAVFRAPNLRGPVVTEAMVLAEAALALVEEARRAGLEG